MDDFPRSADVVIIGGGPAGTAALWAIERAAPGTKTVLIEQADRLGSGASTASLENFRTCWPAECLAAMMARSVDIFLHADETFGEEAAKSLAVKVRGYLFCAFTEHHAATLLADVDRLHSIGLTAIEYLDASEVAYRFGWVGPHVIAAKYDPTAGWLDSNGLIHAYAASVPSARILLGVPDVRLRIEGSRVTGVTMPDGEISAPRVVLAAGAGSVTVAKVSGLHLPLIVRPRQSFTTGWRHDPFPEDAPMLIGEAPFPHVRPEAQTGAIFGWEYTWCSRNFAAEYGTNPAHDALLEPAYPVSQFKDPRFPSLTLALLARQFRHTDGAGFADGRYLRGLHHNAGYYVYRDDSVAYRTDEQGAKQPYDSERAIIDAYPDVEGLVVSVAHVGHGIMSSPAAGEIAAAHVLGLPLPDPLYAEFGFAAPWVAYDEGVL